jgi:hypothetical protein
MQLQILWLICQKASNLQALTINWVYLWWKVFSFDFVASEAEGPPRDFYIQVICSHLLVVIEAQRQPCSGQTTLVLLQFMNQ